jgi:hypothetical protein
MKIETHARAAENPCARAARALLIYFARAGFNFHNFIVAKSLVCYLPKNPLGGTGAGGIYIFCRKIRSWPKHSN